MASSAVLRNFSRLLLSKTVVVLFRLGLLEVFSGEDFFLFGEGFPFTYGLKTGGVSSTCVCNSSRVVFASSLVLSRCLVFSLFALLVSSAVLRVNSSIRSLMSSTSLLNRSSSEARWVLSVLTAPKCCYIEYRRCWPAYMLA